MALIYLEESEAEAACEETLLTWVTTSNYKGCYSAKETRDQMANTLTWAKNSPTAAQLLQFVADASVEIRVIGMRGGYQCFDTTGTKDKQPVVFIDLDGRLQNYVRQPHQVHIPPEQMKSVAQQGDIVSLDNRIALLHEFGHAKQFIERPLLFAGHYKQGQGKVGKFLKVGGKAVGLEGEAPLGSFASAIQERAQQMWKKKGVANPDLLTNEELAAFAPVPGGYAVRIEMDNMARHEWPICKELGIPLRTNYRDLFGGTSATASQTSTLLKRANEQQQAKQREIVQLAPGACPYCPKKFPSNSRLRVHVMNDHKDKPPLD